jgi:hypothetical protein
MVTPRVREASIVHPLYPQAEMTGPEPQVLATH